MALIESEWQQLRGELTDEMAKDGRRCFYCGVLLVLSWLAEGNGCITEQQMDAAHIEIKAALKLKEGEFDV